jgi:hypothetical protein
MSLWPLGREDQAILDRSLGAHVQRGRSGRQTKTGASGSELLVAGKHVPDRVREPAGDVDLSDLGAALLAEPLLGALVALGVGGVAKRMHRRLEQRPAQVGRPVLGQRPAAVLVARLVDARAKAGIAGELLR